MAHAPGREGAELPCGRIRTARDPYTQCPAISAGPPINCGTRTPSRWRHESVPLIVVQRQLGHSNLGITSIYVRGIDNAEVIEGRPRPPRAHGPRQRLASALMKPAGTPLIAQCDSARGVSRRLHLAFVRRRSHARALAPQAEGVEFAAVSRAASLRVVIIVGRSSLGPRRSPSRAATSACAGPEQAPRLGAWRLCPLRPSLLEQALGPCVLDR